ncbi:PREDICTED: ankyrin repeat and SOCS box protein 12-like [Nanorana parkeri]|uniref:ankyrin repeat and SOCS box protein 12-like n=1 Tax=Nanorana parkeri TaxID=125878 RepID=UPI0008550402|nr:PREDICTED: ankyrin repeat and SOCS box protein 12-like [Nanorana parkeri]
MLRYRGLEDDHVESRELHLAVSLDDPQHLAKLLSLDRYKNYVDSRSGWGVPMTPLRQAASNGSVECLKILLANGAEVDSLDVKAQTPLFAAVSGGHSECVRVLLEAGANPRGSVHNNCTPVLTAAREGNAQILKELLEYGADANVRAKLANRATPNPGCTGPLYLAAVYGHLECFRSLLLYGADPNYNCTDLQLLKKMKHPQSVLEICLKHQCHPEFVKLLIDFGADLYLPNVHAMSLSDSPSLKLIEREKGFPGSLMFQCRVTIRRLLKQMGKLHLIDQLEMPDRIVGYLQHHNSYCQRQDLEICNQRFYSQPASSLNFPPVSSLPLDPVDGVRSGPWLKCTSIPISSCSFLQACGKVGIFYGLPVTAVVGGGGQVEAALVQEHQSAEKGRWSPERREQETAEARGLERSAAEIHDAVQIHDHQQQSFMALGATQTRSV